MVSFGDWLLGELRVRNISQADLSRASGLTTAAVANLVNGRRNPGIEAIVAISRALRLPPETVFAAAGAMPTKSVSDERVSRFETLLKDLSDDDVDDLYALALSKLERKSQRKLKPAT